MDASIELHHLSDLLLSISGIVKSSDINRQREYKLDVLGKLCVFVLVWYPRVPSPFFNKVKLSIIQTIINVELTDPLFLDSFLDKTGN